MCVDKPVGKDGEEKDYESFRKFRYKVFVKYNARKKELEKMVNKIDKTEVVHTEIKKAIKDRTDS